MRYDPKVITYSSFGWQGKDLIIAADLIMRTAMFRINTLQPTLSGTEIMASLLTSNAVVTRRSQHTHTHTHAAHLPTHHAMAEGNRRYNTSTTVPKSVVTLATPRGRVGSTGEICRLYATGSCKWGDACKRVRDNRALNPSPGVQNRTDTERGARKRRRNDRDRNLRPTT